MTLISEYADQNNCFHRKNHFVQKSHLLEYIFLANRCFMHVFYAHELGSQK